MAITPERLDFLRKNSKLRLDREGRWSLDGRPVENDRVQRLFHAGIRPADDGKYTLHVGTQWAFIQFLEDTAYFVERARTDASGMTLVLADGAEQRLDPATVTMAGPQDVYCRLENGHRARFLRDALAAMSPLLEERHGRVGLRIGDEFFEIVATKGE